MGVKIFSMTAQESRDLEEEMIRKLETLVTSSDLEVQERASTSLQILKYVQKIRDKGEEIFEEEMKTFLAGELNPVGPKAQKKVPVPEGLDLDAWINEPEEEESEEDDEPETVNGGNVFVKEDPDAVRRKVIEPTEEELEANRQARMQYQSANPNYLKDTPKASPSRGINVEDIPVQEIELDIPLNIPGLANTDSY